jgi:hypothetical protein
MRSGNIGSSGKATRTLRQHLPLTTVFNLNKGNGSSSSSATRKT